MIRHRHPTKGACRVMLLYSPGGHRREMELAVRGLRFQSVLCATFPPLQGVTFDEPPETQKTVGLTHPRRNPLRVLRNCLESAWHLAVFRPCVVISSGADVTVPSFVLAKSVFRSTTIFIESAGTAGPTLSGRLCRPFADLMLVQWPEQEKAHAGARLLSEQLI